MPTLPIVKSLLTKAKRTGITKDFLSSSLVHHLLAPSL